MGEGWCDVLVKELKEEPSIQSHCGDDMCHEELFIRRTGLNKCIGKDMDWGLEGSGFWGGWSGPEVVDERVVGQKLLTMDLTFITATATATAKWRGIKLMFEFEGKGDDIDDGGQHCPGLGGKRCNDGGNGKWLLDKGWGAAVIGGVEKVEMVGSIRIAAIHTTTTITTTTTNYNGPKGTNVTENRTRIPNQFWMVEDGVMLVGRQ